MTQPTRELPLNLTLLHGSHAKFEDGVCAMEAIAFIAGEPHSDHPKCACPVIAALLRSANDRLTDEERQLLVPLLPLVVGTRSTPEVERKRAWIAADWVVRDNLPRLLRLVPSLAEHAAKVEALPELTSREAWEAHKAPVLEARKAAAAAYAAAYAAARKQARAESWPSLIAMARRMIEVRA